MNNVSNIRKIIHLQQWNKIENKFTKYIYDKIYDHIFDPVNNQIWLDIGLRVEEQTYIQI
jgi:hypothetical protein